MHIDESVLEITYEPDELGAINRWIKASANQVVRQVNEALDAYRFHEASDAVYHFVWHQFCDWYIELIKPVLFDKEGCASEREQAVTKRVLYETLDTICRLMHPMIPFITEEIWQKLPGAGETIMLAPYPEADETFADFDAGDMDRMMEIIFKIRNMRSELQIPLQELIELQIFTNDQKERDFISTYKTEIKNLPGVEKITFVDSPEPGENIAHAVAGGIDIMIPYGRYVDVKKEKERIERDMARLEKDIDILEKKLNNESFVKKAPEDVVQDVRGRYNDLMQKYKKLEQNLKSLE
jgi:valyl-tRNA synthetase